MNDDKVDPKEIRAFIEKLERMAANSMRFECSGKTCSSCSEPCIFYQEELTKRRA